MWQRKYASAVPKNLGVGVNFRPCWASVGRDLHLSAQRIKVRTALEIPKIKLALENPTTYYLSKLLILFILPEKFLRRTLKGTIHFDLKG